MSLDIAYILALTDSNGTGSPFDSRVHLGFEQIKNKNTQKCRFGIQAEFILGLHNILLVSKNHHKSSADRTCLGLSVGNWTNRSVNSFIYTGIVCPAAMKLDLPVARTVVVFGCMQQ